MRPPDAHARAAFTLIEVAAALAILGGVIASLLAARTRAMRTHYAARDTMACTRICADLAAHLRAGLAGTGTGVSSRPPGYRWAITIAEVPEDAPPGLLGYQVCVTPASPDSAASAASVSAVVWVRPSQGPPKEGS